jgi:hypothetical protein
VRGPNNGPREDAAFHDSECRASHRKSQLWTFLRAKRRISSRGVVRGERCPKTSRTCAGVFAVPRGSTSDRRVGAELAQCRCQATHPVDTENQHRQFTLSAASTAHHRSLVAASSHRGNGRRHQPDGGAALPSAHADASNGLAMGRWHRWRRTGRPEANRQTAGRRLRVGRGVRPTARAKHGHHPSSLARAAGREIVPAAHVMQRFAWIAPAQTRARHPPPRC